MELCDISEAGKAKVVRGANVRDGSGKLPFVGKVVFKQQAMSINRQQLVVVVVACALHLFCMLLSCCWLCCILLTVHEALHHAIDWRRGRG